jgi:hypothetical protein
VGASSGVDITAPLPAPLQASSAVHTTT